VVLAEICGPQDMMLFGQENGLKTQVMEILGRAHQEDRVLVTLDKDFGEMAIVRRLPHSGIIRLVNLGARQQAPSCLRVIGLHEKELKAGAIITVEPTRLRIRLATDQVE
jgi:predicted nuclease of predicted toxin-antitoxin system